MTDENTLQEAFKNKAKFTELMKNTPVSITQELANYPMADGKVIIHVAELTQTEDTFFNVVGDKEFANLPQMPFFVWIITNEKEKIMRLVNIINKNATSGFGIFVFKASLNGNKICIECLAKPEVKVKTTSGGKAKQIQYDYWKNYNEICDELAEGDYQIEPKAQHWQYIPLGKTGVSLQLTVNTQIGSIAVDFFISNDKSLYSKLETAKIEIEKELGTLDWICNDNVKSSRIRKSIKCDIQNEETIKETVTQHIGLAKVFKATFSKYL